MKKLSFVILAAILCSLLTPMLCTSAYADSPDTFADAKQISVNTYYSDNIENNTDVDFYSFNLSNSGIISISFDRKVLYDSEECWLITLFNQSTNTICKFSLNGLEKLSNTYEVGLSAGKYFVRVSGGHPDGAGYYYHISTEEYKLKVNYQKNQYCETENNDTFATATALSVNKPYQGSINYNDDIDYYSFNLQHAGTINLTFERKNLVDKNEFWKILLYNSNTELICEYSIDGLSSSTETYTVGLGKGTYFIRITGGRWDGSSWSYSYSTETYTMTVNYIQTDDCEKENNDSFSTSTRVDLNKPYIGSINSNGDIDYYRFEMKAPGLINLSFARASLSDTKDYWRVVLWNDQTEKICEYYFNGNETQTDTYVVGLNTGVYYLEITGGNWDGAGWSYQNTREDYRIAINCDTTKRSELERNETFADATNLERGYSYYGSINSDRDIDFYKFTVGKTGKYDVVLNHEVIDDSEEYWAFKIYDESGECIRTVSASGRLGGIITWLDKGNYYLRITGGKWDGAGRSYQYSTTTYSVKWEPDNVFDDVIYGKYYYDAVIWAYYHEPEITGGTDATHFSPGKTCTREQIVSFLWKAYGAEAPTMTNNPFSDVKESKYYYKAVLWAMEKGITGGVSGGKFGVGKSCTREQAVSFLWKAAGAPEPKGTDCPFEDVKPEKYYYKAVLWAVENGVTGGTSATKFGVGKACTRGQIVTFLYKALGENG